MMLKDTVQNMLCNGEEVIFKSHDCALYVSMLNKVAYNADVIFIDKLTSVNTEYFKKGDNI